MDRTRLYLLTPRDAKADAFAPLLEAALAAGDIAALLIDLESDLESDWAMMMDTLAPLAQRAGVAVLTTRFHNLMRTKQLDGYHASESAALREALQKTTQPDHIFGAGGLRDRHDAMVAGENGADYVFFGRLDIAPTAGLHRKTRDLATWWCEMFEVPCVALAGTTDDGLRDLALMNADFIAVRELVWQDEEGPASAVQRLNALLEAAADERLAIEKAQS